MKQDLRQRFLNHEVSPPPSVWTGIAVNLRNETDDLFLKRKVLDMEVEPPSGNWRSIFEAISVKTKHSGNLFLFTRKRLSRSAAILVGVILAGSFILVNNKIKKITISRNGTASSGVPKKDLSASLEPTVLGKQVISQIEADIPKVNSFYSGFKIKKQNPANITRSLDQTVVKEYQEIWPSEPSISARPIRNEEGDIIQDNRLMSRANTKYVSVTGPNGAQTKISAKFANFLLYLNGDNDTDSKEGIFHKSFLESLTWKAKFQNWRNAISQNTFVPTSTNFMDIMELKDLILQQTAID